MYSHRKQILFDSHRTLLKESDGDSAEPCGNVPRGDTGIETQSCKLMRLALLPAAAARFMAGQVHTPVHFPEVRSQAPGGA
jgi:hypothetical protein